MGFLPESPGRNLALTVLCGPYSLNRDRGASGVLPRLPARLCKVPRALHPTWGEGAG